MTEHLGVYDATKTWVATKTRAEEQQVVGTTLCERLVALGPRAANTPKLLVVLAHPDDEVLALGGRLEWLTATRFLTVTDGVPLDGVDARAHGFADNERYGAARRAELANALQLAGLDPRCTQPLEIGPGRLVSDQRAAFDLVTLARELSRRLQDLRPHAVLTHPYEGGHPDHDACAFAVHAAVGRCGLSLPIVEAPFYHASDHGLETGRFLSGDPGLESVLTPDQAKKKQALLACFVSQAETLRLFGTEKERFRVAPAYDFQRRPHPGELYYERFPWGMQGDRFCGLAKLASQQLGLPE